MRPDEILDLSSSKNLSHFQARKEKNQTLFNVFFGTSILCIICILGVILKVPAREIRTVSYVFLFLFMGFIGGAAMLCATFFKFLATHHERNIAAYQKTTYPFANNIFMARVYFFISTLIFAIVINFVGDNLDKYTRQFERGEPREWAISLFVATLITIGVFFYTVGLNGVYQWALHLDHKIRAAHNYNARINIILPRFLIFLGVGLLLIFDVFLNDFYIANSLEAFAIEFEKDLRLIIIFSFISLFFNYLVFGAFSLFLWIHTIISYKNQDAENSQS
jgi:hypothetical protein